MFHNKGCLLVFSFLLKIILTITVPSPFQEKRRQRDRETERQREEETLQERETKRKRERETKRKRERRQALAFLLPIVSFALKADNTHSEQNENKKAFSYFFVFGSILSNKRIFVKKNSGRIL